MDSIRSWAAGARSFVKTVLSRLWVGTGAVLHFVWTVLSVIFHVLGAVFRVLGPLFSLLDALTGGSGSSSSANTESDGGGSFS